MKKNVLIVGAGAVAHVAAHKAAQNNDILGDICIASRTQKKCDAIIESVKRKKRDDAIDFDQLSQDSVQMYLREIGRISLLTGDEEKDFSQIQTNII